MPYGTNRTDWTEEERLAVLHAYGILDTPAERTFDDIAALAAEICNAPIALVSLVDDDRQWFKARVGLDASQTSREVSFCAHAMREPDTMVVPDATLDPRFRENPLVTDEPRIRFYAGALLRPKEGVPLGSLCVIDTRPRPDGLTDLQQRSLERLARQVVSLLELRRAVREREASLLAQADSEARFRVLADSMPQMVWSASPDGLHDYFNARWYEFTGAAAGATDGEAWNDMFHPDDRDRAWTLWRHSLETGLPYEIEYRLRHYSGVYRWTLGRATPLRTASGEIIRWFGTCTDIDDLKRLHPDVSFAHHSHHAASRAAARRERAVPGRSAVTTNPSGRQSWVRRPPSCPSTDSIANEDPKPVRTGTWRMLGPPVSCHVRTKRSPALRVSTDTRPSGSLRAPYFAALVASSWNSKATEVAA